MSTMMFPLVGKFCFPLFIGCRQETFRCSGMVVLLEHVFGSVVTETERCSLGVVSVDVRTWFTVEGKVGKGAELPILVNSKRPEKHVAIVEGENQSFPGEGMSGCLTVGSVELLVLGGLM